MSDQSTLADIKKVENVLGFELPRAYRELIIRYGPQKPIVGTDCALADLISNNQYLPNLLQENQVEHQLPKKLLCFLIHQGYIAAWLDAENGDDPECWFFSEGTTPSPIQEERVSVFFEKLIKDWGMNAPPR
jgi:hypothetical protein